MERIKIICLAVTLLLVAACGKKSSSNDNPPQGSSPAKALLVSPANNEPCNTGANPTATKSTVNFSWKNSTNADSYDINITNLLTNKTQNQTATANQVNVTLDINTPYSWYVISKSKSSSVTAQSDTWKFYNSGPGATSHAPFPAELTSPALGDIVPVGTVNLTWTGDDVDNDITTYSIYFGTTSSPPLFQSLIVAQTFSVQAVAGTTYYWFVVTNDAQGNSSTSQTFSFTAN